MRLRLARHLLTANAGCSLADATTALPYLARLTGHANVIWQMPWGTTLGYSLQGSSHRYSHASYSWRYRLDAFAEHSLTLGQRWHGWTLQAAIVNLCDRQYEIIQYYPMPGRHVRFTLSKSL